MLVLINITALVTLLKKLFPNKLWLIFLKCSLHDCSTTINRVLISTYIFMIKKQALLISSCIVHLVYWLYSYIFKMTAFYLKTFKWIALSIKADIETEHNTLNTEQLSAQMSDSLKFSFTVVNYFYPQFKGKNKDF